MGAKKPAVKKAESTFRMRGVGKQIAKHLARLAIFSTRDLLFHLPIRYQDRTKIECIRQLKMDAEAVVEGVIKSVSTESTGRTKLLCQLQDETGVMHLRFFHFLNFQRDIFKPGTRLRCYGDVRLGAKGLEMVHPEFVVLKPDKPIPIPQHLTPIYPATEGISQYMLRKLTSNALAILENENAFKEILPAAILESFAFLTLKEAIKFVHRPPNDTQMTDLLENKTVYQKRLIFEELIAHRISLLTLKQVFQARKGMSLVGTDVLLKTFKQQLPFQLTGAQTRVAQEIKEDLRKANPMLRLVQGDVGSGKTVVAALAMLQAVESGYQTALMAPTEILAEQHFQVFKRWFEPLGLQVVFLAGNLKASARKNAMQLIRSGEAQVVIGTHALFQEEVKFAKLALVIVDEQHRFGVQQRALFQEKGKVADIYPHQLIMTATPIPRTLAMSLYADLDCSTIDELPPGRTPIVTSVIASTRRSEIIERIRAGCKGGVQVYWVCPLIEESEVIACESAINTAQELQTQLVDFKIGLIHGRMATKEKEEAMRAFKQNETQLLVATTVIEVGVDVPNASLMVIENAERLGLSQLHQLRGRVGRGETASHCVLLYQYPLSELAKERLKVMRETTDGFKIAQRDLELRGPGEVLGTRQTGELAFEMADLIRDSEILPAVHQAADIILEQHQPIIEPLIKRWLAHKQEYGNV